MSQVTDNAATNPPLVNPSSKLERVDVYGENRADGPIGYFTFERNSPTSSRTPQLRKIDSLDDPLIPSELKKQLEAQLRTRLVSPEVD